MLESANIKTNANSAEVPPIADHLGHVSVRVFAGGQLLTDVTDASDLCNGFWAHWPIVNFSHVDSCEWYIFFVMPRNAMRD